MTAARPFGRRPPSEVEHAQEGGELAHFLAGQRGGQRFARSRAKPRVEVGALAHRHRGRVDQPPWRIPVPLPPTVVASRRTAATTTAAPASAIAIAVRTLARRPSARRVKTARSIIQTAPQRVTPGPRPFAAGSPATARTSTATVTAWDANRPFADVDAWKARRIASRRPRQSGRSPPATLLLSGLMQGAAALSRTVQFSSRAVDRWFDPKGRRDFTESRRPPQSAEGTVSSGDPSCRPCRSPPPS